MPQRRGGIIPDMFDLHRQLVDRFVERNGDPDPASVRTRYALLEARVSIVGNLLIFGAQIALALVANSVSLLANAFHTLGDLVSSAVVWFGARAVRKPADGRHPFGHGRAEPIATLIIAMLLVVTGVEFAHLSYHRVSQPTPILGGWLVIAVMAFSIVAKEWMARFADRLAKDASSPMLEADAWHHRSDALGAGLVVLAAIGSRFGYHMLDGVFGFGVAALIGFAGCHMGVKMISLLLGEAPGTEVLDGITNAAHSIRGVRSVHDVQVHDYGSNKHVSLHVEVSPDSTTQQSHDTATSVENAIHSRMDMAAVVHVDPARSGVARPELDEVRAALDRLVRDHSAVEGFHSLHAVTDSQGAYVELTLTLDPSLGLAESHALVHDIADHIVEDTGVPKINIHVEPHQADNRTPGPP